MKRPVSALVLPGAQFGRARRRQREDRVMIAVDPLHAAISTHRAAYDAFQVGPDDEAEDACCATADALDALVLAACAFPILAKPLPDSAGALLVV